jgi:hypothetical protein
MDLPTKNTIEQWSQILWNETSLSRVESLLYCRAILVATVGTMPLLLHATKEFLKFSF